MATLMYSEDEIRAEGDRVKSAIRACGRVVDVNDAARTFAPVVAKLSKSGIDGQTMVIQIKNLAAYRRWEIRRDE